jgi:Flp pilus assembly protein TadD
MTQPPPSAPSPCNIARLAGARTAFRAGNFNHAEALCREVLTDHPSCPEALRLLATVLLALDRPEAALDCVTLARPAGPDDIDRMLLEGRILTKLMRFEEAAALLQAALALAPDRPEIITELGVAQFELDRFGPALELFRRAFKLAPQNARIVANLGNFLDFAGTLDLSLAAYDAARSLSPDDREIRCNHGMALLRAGRLAEGWPLFESRRRPCDPAEAAGIARLPAPLDPAELAGKRVLLFHEQGFGDSLQFLRYAPMLAALGAVVILRMPPPLARLAGTVIGVAEILTDDTLPPDLDFVSPLMSLPLCFSTVLETIPAAIPYLHPPQEARERWRAALAEMPRPRIGLVWAGSPRGGLDRRRSMPFDALLPLFDRPGSFVSLQLGEAARQWLPPPSAAALDPTAGLVDFAETAALASALDLVVSVDTSTAHIAGAVGTPVWVVSRFASCWRWLTRRDDSPWYPGLRLFRQAAPGDWAGAVARIALALDHFSGTIEKS